MYSRKVTAGEVDARRCRSDRFDRRGNLRFRARIDSNNIKRQSSAQCLLPFSASAADLETFPAKRRKTQGEPSSLASPVQFAMFAVRDVDSPSLQFAGKDELTKRGLIGELLRHQTNIFRYRATQLCYRTSLCFLSFVSSLGRSIRNPSQFKHHAMNVSLLDKAGRRAGSRVKERTGGIVNRPLFREFRPLIARFHRLVGANETAACT